MGMIQFSLAGWHLLLRMFVLYILILTPFIMDFLPVNTSQNQRLQYTESYVLPQDTHIPEGPNHFEEGVHMNGYAPSQHNHSGMMPQSKVEIISGKQDPSVVKAHQEIDDYIKRRSHIANEEHFNEAVNSSDHTNQPNNHSIHESKPVVLESIVKNIDLTDSDWQRKALPQMVATNDNMELPVIKQSQLDRFDSSNNLQPLGEIHESRRLSAVVSLHQRLQQSSVNINLGSQIRNYVPPKQQAQQSLALEGVTQNMNNEIKGSQLPRNLQRYVVHQIPQHEEGNIDESRLNKSSQNGQQIINIPQIQSEAAYRATSKQSVRRNLIQIVPQNSINRNSALRQSHSIEINNQLNESFNGKDSFNLKRSLKQSQKLSNSSQQIVIDQQYSGQFHVRSNGIPLQRSFVVEKPQGPKSIIIDPENHSLNNSLLAKQQRQLQQRRFLDQSIPIELQQFLDEDLSSPYLKSSLKRQLQYPIKPPSIQVQIQQQNQNYLNESLRSSLRRQLEAQKAEAPVNIEIEQQDHYINGISLKSSERRRLQSQAPPPPLRVEIPLQDYHILQESLKKSIKRKLQPQALSQPVSIQIPNQNEQALQQSLKNSLRRKLQSQAPPPPVYVQIPLQDQHILYESLKSSLKRKLQQQAQPPSVSVQIPLQNEHILQESLKSTLRRKLESPAPPPPIYVQIPFEDYKVLQESQRKTLKRKLQSRPPSQPVSAQIPFQNEQVLQESLKGSIRQKLQSQPQPLPIYIQITDQDYRVLQESQKQSLRRKLNAQVPPPPVNISIGQDNERYMAMDASKSSLRRHLEAVQQPDPIFVHLNQHQHSLYQSQRRTLRRKIFPPSHEDAIIVDLGPLKEHQLQESLKGQLKRHLQPLPHEKLYKNEVQPSIQVELNDTNQQSLQEKLKSSLRRKLDAPVSNRHIDMQEPIIPSEIMQDVRDPLNDSIHLSDLSERMETIDTPRNITMLRRDLKLNQPVPGPMPQPPVNLREASQQVIDSSTNRIIDEPVQMKRSVHLNYVPCEEDVKSKALLLSKRHLKAEPSLDSSQRTCEEGWNPTKNIFNLFRIPATTNSTSQISFKKHRINTSFLLH